MGTELDRSEVVHTANTFSHHSEQPTNGRMSQHEKETQQRPGLCDVPSESPP